MISFLKKFNREFLTIFIITALLLFVRTNAAFAAEETGNHIKIEAKGEDKGLGIFNDKDGLWYPGRSLTKGFIVKSNYEKEVQFNKLFVNVEPLGNKVDNKVFNFDGQVYKQFSKYLKVTLRDESSVFYNGTFEDFSSKGVELSTPIKVSPNSQKDFMLTLSFDGNAGNDFQNLTHEFSIAIQYTLADESSTIETSIPPIETNVGGVQSGSNGANLPRTGRLFDFAALLFLGMMLSTAGFFLISSNSGIFNKIFKLKGGK